MQPLKSRLEFLAVRKGKSHKAWQGSAIARTQLRDRAVRGLAAPQIELDAGESRETRRLVRLQVDDCDRGGCITLRSERPAEQSMRSRISRILRDRLPEYIRCLLILACAEVTLREDELRADTQRIPLQPFMLQTHRFPQLPALRAISPRTVSKDRLAGSRLPTRSMLPCAPAQSSWLICSHAKPR